MSDKGTTELSNSLGVNQWIAVGVALLVVGGVMYLSYSRESKSVKESVEITESNTKQMNNISTIKGLEIYDIAVGTGAEAKAGQKITVHYTGTLTNGKKFDSSLDRGMPFEFTLGVGQVIQGWDQGFAGMKIGGKRKLVISPEMGYGAQAVGNVIPANASLVFEVELLGVK